MPELPEVETVRRGLTATIVGRRISDVDVVWPGSITAAADGIGRLAGREIRAVGRHGKLLDVALDRDVHLLVHLMMTGQLVVVDGDRTLFAGGHPSRSMLESMPNATTRVVFHLGGTRHLFFNDGRKFGRIRVADGGELAGDAFLARLGPEPLGDSFTLAGLRSQLARHARAPVKAVLLDQSVVAGIGNIYADESLHRARIHPARAAGNLTPAESRRLRDAIRKTLVLAVENGSTSFERYVNEARGHDGHPAAARVFRREGTPCPTCGATIVRIRVAGRGTNVCPHCQPAG